MNRLLTQFLTTALLTPSLFGCAKAMNYYSKDQIEFLEITQNEQGQQRIQFRPQLDSLYFCPGATLKPTAEFTEVRLVRCSINAQCNVDVASTQLPNGLLGIDLATGKAKVRMMFN